MHYCRVSIFLGGLMVVGGICGAIHQNFANVIESQNFIENTIKLKEVNIGQTLPFTTIYHSLEQQCESSTIKEATTLAEILKNSRTSNFTTSNTLKKEMERRFTMLKNMIPSLKSDNEKVFCKQKYLMYSLLEYTQGLYLGTVKAVSPPLIPQQKPITPPPIIQTPIEQVLEPTHSSAETTENVQYLTLINLNQSLTDKVDVLISQLAEIYIQKEI